MKTKPKLPKTLKNKWIKALRSGEYIQGHSYLKQHDSDNKKNTYCCLGVLCEVVGVKIVMREAPAFISSDSTVIKGYTKIPEFLRDTKTIPSSLAEKNDSGRWSFKKIADWIEKYL